MPLTRYQIRNEYSLADPELYRAADKDDPEALLEGVAMAGLVGVLRQLGDLAEFAAGIFHDLHEEVMATAARGHGLKVRVQQLETEIPSVERAILAQTSHSLFFPNAGVDWHPNLHMDQNLITQADLPRFLMDSYEECRGPPRLFLLDKFDVAGAGACLKRYTDPSFFKVETSSSRMTNAEVQRDKKFRKAKKRGSRWRNGKTSEVNPTSHAKLHQLFREERVENGANDAIRRVKLKRRLNGFPFDSRTGKSYMERFLKSPSPEHKEVHEITVSSPLLELPSNITSESRFDVLEISTFSPDLEFSETKKSPCLSPDVEEIELKSSLSKFNEDVTDEISAVHRLNSNFEANKVLSTLDEAVDEKEIVVDGECKREGSRDGYLSDDITSELDNYTDALTTMESEMENDTDYRSKSDTGFLNIEKQGSDSDATVGQQELQTNFSDPQSLVISTASDDGNRFSNKQISSFQELQTNFSDPQSLVNSIASDDGNRLSNKEMSSFSNYSSLVNLTENIPSDSDASGKVFPCAEIFETEIVDISSKDYFVREGISLARPIEHVASGAASVEVAEITNCKSEFGEPSSSSCLTNATPTFPPIDTEARLKEGGLLGPELDEVSSVYNKIVGLIHTEEDETNSGDNLPGTPNHSAVPAKTRDDFLPVVSSENHLVDGFDEEHPKVFSDTSLQFSNVMDLSPGKKSIENSLDDSLQMENMKESCAKDLVDEQLDSPGSVNSLTEELPLGLALPLLKSCDPDVNGVVSEVDDAVTSDGKVAENSIPVIESPQACNIMEQLMSELTEDVLLYKLESAEVCTLCPEEKNFDVAVKTAVGEETDKFTFNIDKIKKEAVPPGFGSDSLDSPESELDTNIHVYSNEETKPAQSEAVGMTSASAYATSDEINLSTNFTKLREKSLLNLEDSSKNGLEDQTCLSLHLRQSGTETEVDEQAVLSPDLKSNLCNISCSELLNEIPNSSMALDDENGWHPHDANIVPSSSCQSGQDSGSKSPQQSNLTGNEVDPVASSTPRLTELKDPPEPDFKLQAVQLDGECWHADEAVQLEQTQTSHLFDHERCSDASQLYPTPPPSKLPVAEFLPQSGSCMLHVSEQAPDPLLSNFPGFGLFPVTTQLNLEEMPPLPPLPPMQWRMGKTQHASLALERESVKHDLVPSQPEFSSASNEQSLFGYPAIEGESTQLSNPFLPLAAVKNENSPHVYENSAADMVHSSPLSLQVPAVLNHGNSQVDFLSSSKTESMITCSVLPATSNQMPQNRLLALEGGILQPSSDPSSTITNIENTTSAYDSRSLLEKVTQPLLEFTLETNPGPEKLQSSCVVSEVKVASPLDPTMQLPLVENEQLQHALPTLEGEDGKSNGSRQMKLPRPRNPLIDAVVALDKSKLRKVTERVRPQIEQKVDERDSLLEQIRTKSFNLKPAATTRPIIQGPKTNLKVAAILEKANAIRQAFAGSDEDDDADNWSDA